MYVTLRRGSKRRACEFNIFKALDYFKDLQLGQCLVMARRATVDKILDAPVYSVSQKNIPDIFSCNSRKHCRIFIIFGTHVTEKVSNQQMPTAPN